MIDRPFADPKMMGLVQALKDCDRVRVHAMSASVMHALEEANAPALEVFWVLASIIVALVRATEEDSAAVLAQVQTMISFSMGMAEQDDAEKREALLH